MAASRTMRCMTASPIAQPEVLPAPGAERYPALDLVNSVVTLPGGRSLDLLATPSGTEQWLTAHGLASTSAGLQEGDAERIRALRAHIRSVIVSKVHGHPASEADLQAVNDALTRAPAPCCAGTPHSVCTARPYAGTAGSSTTLWPGWPRTRPTCSPAPMRNASPRATPPRAVATCSGTAAGTGVPRAAVTVPAPPARTPGAHAPRRLIDAGGKPAGIRPAWQVIRPAWTWAGTSDARTAGALRIRSCRVRRTPTHSGGVAAIQSRM